MFCYLIRHGQDDPTVRGGWSKGGLIEEGKQQANQLADTIGQYHGYDIQKVYTSDLARAIETALPIANRLGLSIIPMPVFREVNNGELAGIKNEEALIKYPGLFWNQLEWEEKYPNGESPYDFYLRIYAAWEAFSTQVTQQEENVALITHSGVITVILDIIQGKQYSNKNRYASIPCASFITLEYKDGSWKQN